MIDLKEEEGGRRASEPAQKSIGLLRPQFERYEALCKEVGQEPANIALPWLLRNDAVITGRRFNVTEKAINVPSVGYGEVVVLELQSQRSAYVAAT